MAKVGIMGAGSWGTAISWLLTNNGHEVTVWSIDAREVEMLDQERSIRQSFQVSGSGYDPVYQCD